MTEPPAGELPTFADVVAAAGRLAGRAARTPVIRSERFDARCGRQVHLKCENLQHGGAFKFRGAMNAALQLPPGVEALATHSSGNHGAALALAARALGLRCIVVAPSDASAVKLAAIRAAGAELVHCAPGLAAREAALAEVLHRVPAHVVHPFDDARVIAGQGTAALELHAEVPGLQVVATPVGGGGLIGGTALATRGAAAGCRVVAVEPALADDAYRSFHGGRREGVSGSPPTIADGLRGSIGRLNYALLRSHVDDVLTVEEAAIVAAMRAVLEDFRLLVEPSSAVPIAALLDGRLGRPGEAVGVVVSGGNVDLGACPFLAGRAPLAG
jgi:threonine dehydratase